MGRKNASNPPAGTTHATNLPRILTPEKKVSESPREPHVSRDPLYETDRYRLVLPISPEPGHLDVPELRPAGE